ncbi:hypothetical protein M0802_010215 [Mischocyttarus mexicanus]|nr:hypothetical protein M0802_010215 [Mischocyttarus mexicanus]
MLLSELDKCHLFFDIINGPSKLKIQNKIIYLRILDNASHFLVKAACSSRNLKWIIIQEIRLFLWRISTLTLDEIKEFITINKIQTYDISKEEEKGLEEFMELSKLYKNMQFYKVPFQAVPDLVALQKVFVKNGMAFVPEKELAGLCCCYFKKNLLTKCDVILYPKDAKDNCESSQFKDILDTINNYLHLQRDCEMVDVYSPSVNELDFLLPLAYPLCMRLIHENLRKDHHLKHGARLHCYSCSFIINSNENPTESYGCPFKTLTNVKLREKLTEYQFELLDIEDIVTSSMSKNYQKACMKYYKVTNNDLKHKPFHSPVEYFCCAAYNKNNNSNNSF